MEKDSRELAKLVYKALDEKKSEDIRVIEISEISILADYFIIANGNSSSQVDAMVDAVEEALAKIGCNPKRVEGVSSSGWILLDYGDIVVHIFSKEDRLFYDLERIWRDGKAISAEELLQ